MHASRLPTPPPTLRQRQGHASGGQARVKAGRGKPRDGLHHIERPLAVHQPADEQTAAGWLYAEKQFERRAEARRELAQDRAERDY